MKFLRRLMFWRLKYYVVAMMVPQLRGKYSVQRSRSAFGAYMAWGVTRVVDGPYYTREEAAEALIFWRERLP